MITYHVKKSLRELVVFSKHNIIGDAPFLNMDFISCRNMLIYFNQTLQDRFFPIVHYALNKNAILFLGKSESIGDNIDLFVPLDKKDKIFKAQFTGNKKPPRLYSHELNYQKYDKPIKKEIKKDENALEEVLSNALIQYVFKECVVINSSDDIIYLKGDNPFLHYNQGKISNNIYKSIHESLNLELRSVLSEAKRTKTIKSTPTIVVRLLEDIEKYVQITVIPQQLDENKEFMYALFFHTQAEVLYSTSSNTNNNTTNSTTNDKLVSNLQQELNRTKAHLQNVIEELETSYEQMQSLNEELSSSNEQLQSTNEELETTNEELQSTNEELQTAYSELKALYDDKEDKSNKLKTLSETLQSQKDIMAKQKELTETIVQSVPVGIIAIDENAEIILINKNVQKLFECEEKPELFDEKTYEKLKNSMPFELIKKSLEPLYKIEQIVEKKDGTKIKIRINAVPLLNKDGDFIAAIFSITQKYNNEIDYDESINTQFAQNQDSLSLAIADISKTFKSYISDLSLLTHSLKLPTNSSKQVQDIQNDIDATIYEATQAIEKNMILYNKIKLAK